MKDPILTVIIPAYNCRPFIVGAVQSCFRQGLDAIEVLVVNDGSTDGTEQELRRKINDPRLVVIDTANQGVSAARNLGVRRAKGKYITFLDGDDEFGERTLKENIVLLESLPRMPWLFFPIQRVDGNGQDVEEISKTLLPSFHYQTVEELSAAEAFLRISRREMPVCVWGAIYRREFFDIAFPPGRFEDTVALMELLRKDKPMILSPYGSYRYFDRPNSFINAKWDVSKWEGYTNALSATWQTSDILIPSRSEIVAKSRTNHYYKLMYLNRREPDSNEYRDLFENYKTRVGNIEKSCKLLLIILLKSTAYRILHSVTRR